VFFYAVCIGGVPVHRGHYGPVIPSTQGKIETAVGTIVILLGVWTYKPTKDAPPEKDLDSGEIQTLFGAREDQSTKDD